MCGHRLPRTALNERPSVAGPLGVAHSLTRANVTVMSELQWKAPSVRESLAGGWRDLRYIGDLARGPDGGPFSRCADACESVAWEDVQFWDTFDEKSRRTSDTAEPDFQLGRRAQARTRELAADATAIAAQRSPPHTGRGVQRSA